MKTRTKILISIFTVTVISAASYFGYLKYQEKKRLEHEAKVESALMEFNIVIQNTVISHVKSSLKDPYSAKFSAYNYGKQGMLCGEVNARNSYGGYTGSKRFLGALGNSLVEPTDSGDSYAEMMVLFNKAWEENCGEIARSNELTPITE